jgi:hypothetical protein
MVTFKALFVCLLPSAISPGSDLDVLRLVEAGGGGPKGPDIEFARQL